MPDSECMSPLNGNRFDNFAPFFDEGSWWIETLLFIVPLAAGLALGYWPLIIIGIFVSAIGLPLASTDLRQPRRQRAAGVRVGCPARCALGRSATCRYCATTAGRASRYMPTGSSLSRISASAIPCRRCRLPAMTGGVFSAALEDTTHNFQKTLLLRLQRQGWSSSARPEIADRHLR